MTIADDMRAASMGELARTKAQLKSANDEIEQLRRDLTLRTHGMFMAQEAAKDLARKLDAKTARCDTWKRIALAYRCDRNEVFGPFDLSRYISGWSIARRMGRMAKELQA